LFYRLNVFPINLPPLRQRKDDILLLADYFLAKLSDKFENKKLLLSNEAAKILSDNYWSGNVRELMNTLERAAILSYDGIIKPSHLMFEKNRKVKQELESVESSIQSLEEETKKIIRKALQITNGKIYGKDGAAELLKVKPTTLQSKINKLKI